MTTVPHLAQTLQTLLTTTAETLARSSGFVQRQSKLTGALFAQALVFGWLANPQATVEMLAQAAVVAGVVITPQGLDQRCTEAAAVFLEALLAHAVQTVVTAEPVAIPLLQRFSAVVLLDCSTIMLPAALAPWWPGCGGTTPAHGSAALKLGVQVDLCRGTLGGPLLYDGRTHESTTALHHAPVPPDALRLADLGFFDLSVFQEIGRTGGYWLSRLHFGTALFDTQGRRWDVLALLAAQDTPQVDLPLLVGAGQRLPARLLALRVPQEVADQRRRRLRATAQNHGRTPSAARLAWCDWTLFITNVPAGKSNCSLSCGRATVTSTSRAVPSPGAFCARSSPSSSPW